MVTIYCLIDPRNNKPFYVGCTKQVLKNRLSGHIGEVKTYHGRYRSEKQQFIAQMMEQGFRPVILSLCYVTLDNADHCEKFYYSALAGLGFDLLQLHSAFFYKRKISSEEVKNKELIDICTNVAKTNTSK